MINDLREFLNVLEAKKDLVHISRPTSPRFEIAAGAFSAACRPKRHGKIKEVASSWLDMPDAQKKELQQILQIK